MSLHESRSSKRNKTSDVRGDASLFTVARTTDQLETIEVEDITRPVRSCVSNPSRL